MKALELNPTLWIAYEKVIISKNNEFFMKRFVKWERLYCLIKFSRKIGLEIMKIAENIRIFHNLVKNKTKIILNSKKINFIFF